MRIVFKNQVTLTILILLINLFIYKILFAGEFMKDINNCTIWNPNPIPNEKAEWLGKCKDGLAHGLGSVQWYKDGKISNKLIGFAVNGKFQDQIKVIYPNGDEYEGRLDENGNKTGNGTYKKHGSEEKILYFNDKQILPINLDRKNYD